MISAGSAIKTKKKKKSFNLFVEKRRSYLSVDVNLDVRQMQIGLSFILLTRKS